MAFTTTLASLFWFLLYLASGLVMLAVFAKLYFSITPHDDMQAIHDGKLAPAVALGGALLGFTFPLLMASYLHASLLGYLVWSGIACLVQLAVFWAMYRVMPRVIETDNVAGATCYAVVAVCAGLMNAASFVP